MTSATTPGRNESQSEAAVRAAVTQFYEAVNALFAGEMAPMEAIWSHAGDVTYMGPAGGFRVGWEAVRADWAGQAARNLGGAIRPEQLHVTVSGDLAAVHNYETGENFDAAGDPLTVSIRATNLFRREDGRWRMIGHHTDLLPFLVE